jgi:hypothetical protein
MTLKTLKDMPFFYTPIRELPSFKKVKTKAFIEEELKAEVIKWVKSIKEKEYEDIMEIPQLKIYTALGKAWIIHFFNLTEEDLKNV